MHKFNKMEVSLDEEIDKLKQIKMNKSEIDDI